MKFLLLALLLRTLTLTAAQTQAPSPGPSGPTNLTAILTKSGQFTTFLRLLSTTQESSKITTQLNNSNTGLTIFAPPDSAFSALKPGLLNSLTDQQKVQLIQFHILPSYMSLSQFQTATNPLRTQAGDFPLNVTSLGNQVNVTTGVVTTALSNTIYTDGELAVYQVDQVLLPEAFFQSDAPAPAPVVENHKKGDKSSGDDGDSTVDSSGVGRVMQGGLNMFVIGIYVVGFCYMHGSMILFWL